VSNLEGTVDLSLFVLVSPYHGVYVEDTEDTTAGNYFVSVRSHMSSVSFDTERCVQLCWILIIFHECLCSFFFSVVVKPESGPKNLGCATCNLNILNV
jgi:hypothetical protein